jgi:hypothetical protein
MIWDDEFVRSLYHELQWIGIERRNFERATEPIVNLYCLFCSFSNSSMNRVYILHNSSKEVRNIS